MQVSRRLRGCAYFLNVWDLEGALGKRSWTSGRGLGVAWTLFLGRLEMSEGGLGDSLGTA